ncbi:hypothetical protein A1Q2_00804 [Trichosporon asahii var. asahii CBS 8904]|uniref:V-type proton ATPase subunit F n=2 Tax=Trichosporon asahii var. asahii TaxID=189963 RepID=K1W7J2_TRIAC|nr:hypothetical protein A1Q1_04637 [Trichosporon asahii var. asahii CBS 2479]EJT52425.1 hypothetical protein A1Q1_04637 [Trichosporon asahii var. asahii CBS 2479]EKD04858.1 hypothetical protein A1Q2_00804 [Trichosporon asahii var. asahii CBS 8904]
MSTTSNPKGRNLIAVIGDEDSVTGLLLAGIGNVDDKQEKNFFIVDSTNRAETQTGAIEAAFQEYTEDRKDIAILLINQHAAFPALLEIPSKEHPYDPSKDSVLKRVQKLRGD